MFETTIPFGEPELMRASAYRLYLKELEAEAAQSGVSSRISSLSPSLRADLYRFEAGGGTSEVLEVVAACVRHGKRVTIHLQFGERVLPLTVFPQERLVHSPVPTDQLYGDPLAKLRVMHVEPALLRPPGDVERALVGELRLHSPLAPLLWELAMRGGRDELLPEIAGPAVYRVAPGLELETLAVRDDELAAVDRLRVTSTNLREIADWPGLNRTRAIRLLNALYLQAGLIVSRSHPGAVSEHWFSALGR
ncbi:MAG: hypothetical protein E6H58_15300 [Betaproteobacteria bacterium]|nr:MAG: hypothetical protein DMF96_03285 [Acidobacteriota bacterium]TMH29943.1 MAG: hypothetical protein E6H58_15300 [Betaproteobacteria bacterium]